MGWVDPPNISLLSHMSSDQLTLIIQFVFADEILSSYVGIIS